NEHLRISLKIIQTMRSLHPSDGSRFPQMEINYGSSINPQTISFELKEAKELCHMIAMILDEHSLQSFL
ncbi:hypothetical protein scyTo_0015775, partial [Scyliorhinus torazame]|nr:hypothetical protein [Scyliorhinus torazame]